MPGSLFSFCILQNRQAPGILPDILFSIVTGLSLTLLTFSLQRRADWRARHLPAPFRFPRRRRPLPACLIRPFEARDFEACREIYCLNEPGRFPSGLLEEFYRWLHSGDHLTLVCESAGVIRAVGGISMTRAPQGDFAFISFGMVHPAHHRRGFGEALLLARVAALPEPVRTWALSMSPAGGSQTYYRRFGFRFTGRFAHEVCGEMEHWTVWITRGHRRKCRRVLADSPVIFDHAALRIPATPPPEPAPSAPPEPAPSGIPAVAE